MEAAYCITTTNVGELLSHMSAEEKPGARRGQKAPASMAAEMDNVPMLMGVEKQSLCLFSNMKQLVKHCY